MPLTTKEKDQRAALDAFALDLGVPIPLTASQAQWLESMTLYLQKLPARMHGGIVRYVLCGNSPGGFLRALLSNDLMAVFHAADQENLTLLPIWWRLLYFTLPPSSYGSSEIVTAWVAQRGCLGLDIDRAVADVG